MVSKITVMYKLTRTHHRINHGYISHNEIYTGECKNYKIIWNISKDGYIHRDIRV